MALPPLKYIDEGSPIAAFSATLRNLVAMRKMLSLGVVFSEAKWRVFIEDLQMLVEEGVTFGCRTAWVRRVAVPMFMAQRALDLDNDDEITRAKTAFEVLGQLKNADDALMATCRNWIQERFLKAQEQPK